MVRPFTLPPACFGPGSQPLPENDLQYLSMPSGMRTYSPHIPDADADDPAALAEARALLADMAAACDSVAQGGTAADFDLAGLSRSSRAVVADALGQGEVSMRMRGVPAILVQESVFAGVWMLVGVGVDRVKVAPAPSLALTGAHLPHRPAISALAGKGPGLANSPAILSELMDKSATRARGAMAHVVNLSLLPHTPEDLVWLDGALGEGAVTILSCGYGNCRITATGQAKVWKVQFFNSMDSLILDTYEVIGMPEVALAAAVDRANSATRIRDVIEAIQ